MDKAKRIETNYYEWSRISFFGSKMTLHFHECNIE